MYSDIMYSDEEWESIPSFEEFFKEKKIRKLGYKLKSGRITFVGTNTDFPKGFEKDEPPYAPIPFIQDINPKTDSTPVQYRYSYTFSDSDKTFSVLSGQTSLNRLHKHKAIHDNAENVISEIIIQYFQYVTDYLHDSLNSIKKNGWYQESEQDNRRYFWRQIDDFNYKKYILFPYKNKFNAENFSNLLQLFIKFPNLFLIFS